jgi:hypothetical protein
VPLHILSLGGWCTVLALQAKLPVVRHAVAANEANDDEAGGAVAQVSTLSPNPRSLYLLWEEYDNGIGG